MSDFQWKFYDNYKKVVDAQQQLDQLKAENDELKKQLMQKSEVDMFFNTPIEGWSNDPCGVCKYKQTLTEIKEIAESVTGCGSKCENCETDGYCADCEDEILKQILQKCEVINDK